MSLDFNWDPGEKSSIFLWIIIQAADGLKKEEERECGWGVTEKGDRSEVLPLLCLSADCRRPGGTE